MTPATGVITLIRYCFRVSTGVTYLVRQHDFLQLHIHCQVSYPLSHILTITRFHAMSHTLSGVKSSVTFLDKNKIPCNVTYIVRCQIPCYISLKKDLKGQTPLHKAYSNLKFETVNRHIVSNGISWRLPKSSYVVKKR